MEKEDKDRIVCLLTIMLNAYYKILNQGFNMHYVDLAYDIATARYGSISYEEMDIICDYIGANHTDNHRDVWCKMSVDERIAWFKDEIDKLKNDPSYHPKTVNDTILETRSLVELLKILLCEYENDCNNCGYNDNRYDNFHIIHKVLGNILKIYGWISYGEYRIIDNYLSDTISSGSPIMGGYDKNSKEKLIALLNQQIAKLNLQIRQMQHDADEIKKMDDVIYNKLIIRHE